MLYKLQEALVRLYSMLNEYSKAVKLALTTNLTEEAQMLANRPKSKLQCKQLWVMIAEELLVVQMEGIVPQSGPEFTMKLRNSLGILLKSEQSCLTIEDVLPLLPPKTKMKEIKNFLSTRITGRMDEINRLKKNIERKSKEI